ncbi:uncharacterized protein LOC117112389 [Anneissia japonica]|uniref:uncharacterized protein LOC117112389 n=1 Tax=Anneissia japonica TaxID=1529436 RepID=UPI0014256CDE|nr:uncharacterized protein LOC117112389 [Anneissia japonica]
MLLFHHECPIMGDKRDIQISLYYVYILLSVIVAMPKSKKKTSKPVVEEQTCIIHLASITIKDTFTYVNEERYRRLCEIRDIRNDFPDDFPYKFKDICQNIPEFFDSTIHGYHRACYTKFSAHLKRPTDEKSSDGTKRSRRKISASKSQILFSHHECIFKYSSISEYRCLSEKRRSTVSRGITYVMLSVFNHGGGHTVQTAAEERHDEEALYQNRSRSIVQKIYGCCQFF